MPRMNVNFSLRHEVERAGSLAFRILPALLPQQRISNESLVSSRGVRSRILPGRYGQRVLHVQADRGLLEIDYSARVDTAPHLADPASLMEASVADLPFDVLPFLHESSFCPTESLTRLAFRTFGRMPPGYARVATLCNCVRERTRLEPARSGLPGTALDTLLDKRGASEHFAHLAIALCRALFIPARLVSATWPGSATASGTSGLHYCIEVFLGDRWYLFDPTGVAPVTGLVRIGTGRDCGDIPTVTMQGETQPTPGRLQITALCDASEMTTGRHGAFWAVSGMTPDSIAAEASSATQGRRQA